MDGRHKNCGDSSVMGTRATGKNGTKPFFYRLIDKDFHDSRNQTQA